MEAHWWNLPGPSGFVQGIVQDLRAGKNVVLALPAHAPEGLREAVAERVRENDLWRWKAVRAAEVSSDGAGGIVGALYEKFLPPGPASELRDVAALARRFQGTVVWVEEVAGAAWRAWSQFLAQYQHACQGCPPSERSLFCLPLVGSPTPAPLADVALSIRRWEGVVRRLDMTLYLDRLLGPRFRHPLHHKTALAVVAELAGSDAHLARHLAKEELPSLMSPFEALQAFALARGWSAERVRSAAWHDGTRDVVDGAEMLHSAAAASAGDRAEIKRRVWRGQVAILYPFIEEQRVRVVPLVRGYLRLPLETTYGRVDDPEDLEVGQLLYLLRSKPIQPRLWKRLCLLTEMRHALAHLEPVPMRALLADEVLNGDGAGA
jgi:hypothetical protein